MCIRDSFDTLADSRNVFLRNRTAHNGGSKLEGLFAVGIHRCEVYFTVTVLTTSTRLFCVLAVHIHSLCEGLFVSNLGSAHIGLYLELTKKTVNDDLKMQLAHTGDDGLASLLDVYKRQTTDNITGGEKDAYI